MKHLLTLTALLVSSLAMAQMPYNPDSNGDDLIGSEDLLTFLGVYNTLLIDSSLTCDYEGTELEQLYSGLIDGSTVFDSIYVEYLLQDSVLTYLPGCPEPVFVETVLERSYTLSNVDTYLLSASNPQTSVFGTYLEFYRNIELGFYPATGAFRLNLRDTEVASFFANSDGNTYPAVEFNPYLNIPFPESYTLSIDGIEANWSGWANACEYFRLIPFWSHAE